MTDNRQIYKELCDSHSDIPLFLQYWWMQASCGDAWNVLFSYDSEGEVRGFLCYHLRRKFGFSAILPQLTTLYQGVWVLYPDGISSAHRDVVQREVYEDLATQLDALGLGMYEQAFHYSQYDVEAFIEHGYRHIERCTYIIDDITDIQPIIDNIPKDKRRRLRSARYRALTLHMDMAPEEFYAAFKDELKNKGKKIFYSEDYFLSLHNAAKERGCGQILSLKDSDGNIHSAFWVVWDAMSSYGLVLYINPKFRNDGSSYGIYLEAMKFLSDKTKNFDFDGSMIPTVARRNEMLSGRKVPYMALHKVNNPILRLWRWLKRRKLEVND